MPLNEVTLHTALEGCCGWAVSVGVPNGHMLKVPPLKSYINDAEKAEAETSSDMQR